MVSLDKLTEVVASNDKSKIEELVEEYSCMALQEQKALLDSVKTAFAGSVLSGIYILTYLLYIFKDEKIITYICSFLEHDDIKPVSILNYIYQLDTYQCNNSDNSAGNFLRENMIYLHAIQKLSADIAKDKMQYIPINKRNKNKVIIAARSILAENHAPTMILCNIYNYLQKIGYDVIVLVGYMGGIQTELKDDVYYHAIDNNLIEGTQLLQSDHFGLQVNICNIEFTLQSFNQELEMAVDYVRGVNPEFIIDIGGMNVIADVCSGFTTVCSFPCVGTPVHSAAQVVVRRFHCEGEKDKKYNSYLMDNQKVFELIIANELSVVSNMQEQNAALRNKKEKDKFILLIVGNRLDREVTDEFLNVLNQILEDEPDVYVEVIGECDKLKNKIKTSDKSDRYIFIGYADNLQEAMADGDLFVNPPRTGGGTGASLALKNHTPIVTLGNCDVAIRGEGFVCGELAQYPEIIKKYIHDAGFMKQQQEYCEHQDKLLNNVDSVGNMKKFCEELRNYIIAEEENNGTYSV